MNLLFSEASNPEQLLLSLSDAWRKIESWRQDYHQQLEWFGPIASATYNLDFDTRNVRIAGLRQWWRERRRSLQRGPPIVGPTLGRDHITIREVLNLALREGRYFECAPWVHKRTKR